MKKQHQKRGIERVLRPVIPEDAGYPTPYTTRRFTWKWFGQKESSTWAGGSGKWYKKQLSKTRRQYYNDIDSGRKPRGGFTTASSNANYKGW